MAYNPYYSMSYSPYTMPYQQPQTVQQPQNFSQPTIHADIVQINGDRAEAENYPVPTGGTQRFFINISIAITFFNCVHYSTHCIPCQLHRTCTLCTNFIYAFCICFFTLCIDNYAY